MFVPVVDRNQQPLMPTTPARARRWIKAGKATPFWKKGVFCVRLNVEPSDRKVQPIAVGIDPGSKKEGWSVKSAAHTYLNIQADAVTWVREHVEQRRNMRRSRRYRKTPCRQPRSNRARGGLPPSTKARWQWKLRLARWLVRLFPVTTFVVEDIQAKTKGQRRWDTSFSPLEVGKRWFREQLSKLGQVLTCSGWETKQMRDALTLKKTSKKTAEVFETHCVDAWVLANSVTGGHKLPDNKRMLFLVPLRFHRRQLHRLQPDKKGRRTPYGGTLSLGCKRGSLVRHRRWGLAFVGGSSGNKLSLHRLEDGKRLTQNARKADVRHLSFCSWRFYGW
ncbi:MAG TPA: RRXRR domain-containing protein [Synechococcus sp. M44_DOE_062]|nr:RRXRR domain-containing protein [Synechococcus sp. M44_DOE_062]